MRYSVLILEATMNLQIRDPRAHELARRLAEKRKVTMTDAVIEALEAELRRESEIKPLAGRLAEIAEGLRSKARPGGRDMDKNEIDAMWGHS
jgi:antitoxin VapB